MSVKIPNCKQLWFISVRRLHKCQQKQSMKNPAKNFLSLRVYRHLSTLNILNLMLCNQLMRSKFLVANAARLYKMSKFVIGPGLTNYILNSTFCKALTAGNTLEEAQNVAGYFRKQNIAIILDYCAEGEEGHQVSEAALDENAQMFKRSALALSSEKNEMISIKITGLIGMELLKQMNNSVLQRNRFWQENSRDGKLTGQQAFKGLQKKFSGISDQQLEQYLKNIFDYQKDPREFAVDEVEFKMRHHPYYFLKNTQHKNNDFVIRLFFPLDQPNRKRVQNLNRRLNLICEPFAQNSNDFKILVDAEQSYVQRAIETISEQLQQQYNKNRLYIIPTVQNYLKSSVQRTKYQVQIARRKNLILGAKLVRGAYIVQQQRLARKHNYENPVVPCFQKTTENYLSSFKSLVDSRLAGEVIVATHNQDTITDTARLFHDSRSTIRVSYAQLLGLADHLTVKSKMEGYRVYKYLPWADVEVMVAYMIRRAEELSQMRYPLDAQFEMLKHELKVRYIS